ncbi:MAG: heavy metal-associated domain-containing protein [Crocinitomicaceae bacterium]|nr:heavy metal-associated domain-containing protein [Crocinitomicaceae bacterium]MDG1776752.1 heavy metal-associated domain-containing protein [Crocinitomicaceae bacterium]
MKNLLLIAMLSLIAGVTNAQTSKVSTVKIKTSAECNSCKVRLEDKLNYTSGVKYAELNLEDKNLTVKFNTKKITLAAIRKIIAETGYDADDVKAIPESVKNLPACCQPGGMDRD